uniref:Uncharacterized protein n=1 Tax=viral metagenome TaxID=1070528 RepID=A0A6M3LDT9_9ZZZZ
MPIFELECEECGNKLEIIQNYGVVQLCCEKPMKMMPTSHSMFKLKGDGGYPSRVKEFRNAPKGKS